MKYIGLQTQIRQNNTRSFLLLIGFPALMLVLVWLFFFFLGIDEGIDAVNEAFLGAAPMVVLAVLVWFTIAWFFHTKMIERATGSHSLERKENKRVYNLVENLCISRGISLPKINVIDDDSLNAFASGINERTYTVTLSRGIINKLNDEELEGVIAHELMHIRNRDVRLLIVSIIFVGIFAFVSEMAFRTLLRGGRRSSSSDKKGGAVAAILLILVLAVVGYLISILFRFAISRKREYMADAGAAEMTKKPLALASALRKISKDPRIEAVERDDVAQLFIEHPKEPQQGIATAFGSLFATHPPIEDRIKLLEQF
ncbi:MAG: M48 family metallopeptidase [Chitinophagales bacterium]|nr:M48 family metallopeptidase [Chitinophagales bacterium]